MLSLSFGTNLAMIITPFPWRTWSITRGITPYKDEIRKIKAAIAPHSRQVGPESAWSLSVEETGRNLLQAAREAKLGRHFVHVHDGNGAHSNPAIKPTLMRAIRPTRFHQRSQPDRVASLVERAVHIDKRVPCQACTPSRGEKKRSLISQASRVVVCTGLEPVTPSM